MAPKKHPSTLLRCAPRHPRRRQSVPADAPTFWASPATTSGASRAPCRLPPTETAIVATSTPTANKPPDHPTSRPVTRKGSLRSKCVTAPTRLTLFTMNQVEPIQSKLMPRIAVLNSESLVLKYCHGRQGCCHKFHICTPIASPKSPLCMHCNDQCHPFGSCLGSARRRSRLPDFLTASTSAPSVAVNSVELGSHLWATPVLKCSIFGGFTTWSRPCRITFNSQPLTERPGWPTGSVRPTRRMSGLCCWRPPPAADTYGTSRGGQPVNAVRARSTSSSLE